jgi:YgiT-type zinc finger domain-containing protein
MSIRVRIANPHLRLVPTHGATNGGTLRGEDLDETQPMFRVKGISDQEPHLRCLRCDGRVVRAEAPVHLERPGVHVSWEALPAWVCTRCEAAYFEEGQVRRVQRALSSLRDVATSLPEA